MQGTFSNLITFNIGNAMKYLYENWGVILSLVIGAIIMFSIHSCASDLDAQNREWAKENPIEAARKSCSFKSSGSRPVCWSEADWAIFCERVQCKK